MPKTSLGTTPHIDITCPWNDMEGHNELSNYISNGSFSLYSRPSNWTASVSFIYSKAKLLPRINCTLYVGFCKHFAIFSLLRFATSIVLLKLRNFYITLRIITNGPTVKNGPYLKNIKLGQFALMSALGHNIYRVLNTYTY